MSGKTLVNPRAKKGTTGALGGRLTAQQELFIENLCKNNFNGKAAAISAGVAEKNAARQASLWLDSTKFPHIQIMVSKKLEERRNTSEVDAKRIIQELARIAFFDPRRLLGPDGKPLGLKDMPDDIAAALANISVTYGEEQDDEGNFSRLRHIRYTPHDKLSALKQLSAMLGFDNGEALKIINNVQMTNFILKWDDLYKKQAEMGMLPAPPLDEAEAKIAAMEAKGNERAELVHTIMTPPTGESFTHGAGSTPNNPLRVVDSND